MGGGLTETAVTLAFTPRSFPPTASTSRPSHPHPQGQVGLFDQPYVPEDGEITEPTRQARAEVRAAAVRSTVLLKNDGTLPLTLDGRVLLTGPYATSADHLGAWTQVSPPRQARSPES